MFNFLKKKLKEVFKRTEKELEAPAEAEEKKEEIPQKTQTKQEEKVAEQKEPKSLEEPCAEEKTGEKVEEIREIEQKEIEAVEEIKKMEETAPVEDIEKKEALLEKEVERLEEEKKEIENKEGFFSKFRKAFTSTKIGEDDFERFFSELEEALIENNVAMAAIDSLKKNLKEQLVGKEIKRGKVEEEISIALEKAVSGLLVEPFDLVERIKEGLKEKKPYVIAFFGINGVGKTLTIAKIAHLLKENGISCIAAASDTFRAAAIEQLGKHAEKLGIEMAKHDYGADPSAVAYDAISHAKSRGIDVVLIDTAGRINSKANLMREMEKIIRVTKPDLRIFVGESIAGNDLIEQVGAFDGTAGIDAIILTKADIDERGGACISVSHVTGKPILFLGSGQEYGELKRFDKSDIVKSIFG